MFALLLFAGIGYSLRSVSMALVVAFVIAYLLNPPVYYLYALRVPRRVGSFIVLGGFIAILVSLVFAVLPGVTQEILDASSRLPDQFEAFRKNAAQWLWERFHLRIPNTIEDLTAKFGNEIRNLAPSSSDVAGAFNRALDSAWAALSSLIVPIFAFYLLADFDGIVRYCRKLIPRRMSQDVEGLVIEIDGVISRYIRGQAIRSIMLAFLYAVCLRLVGAKHAIPIGVMIGILTFIPYVGVLFGSLLVLFMTVLDWQSSSHFGAVVGVMAVIFLIDSQLITPGIIGTSAPLKSLEVLLSMIGSVSLFGPVGVLIAVPLGAVIKILLRRIAGFYRTSAFYLGIVEPEPQPVVEARVEVKRVEREANPPPPPPPSLTQRILSKLRPTPAKNQSESTTDS